MQEHSEKKTSRIAREIIHSAKNRRKIDEQKLENYWLTLKKAFEDSFKEHSILNADLILSEKPESLMLFFLLCPVDEPNKDPSFIDKYHKLICCMTPSHQPEMDLEELGVAKEDWFYINRQITKDANNKTIITLLQIWLCDIFGNPDKLSFWTGIFLSTVWVDHNPDSQHTLLDCFKMWFNASGLDPTAVIQQGLCDEYDWILHALLDKKFDDHQKRFVEEYEKQVLKLNFISTRCNPITSLAESKLKNLEDKEKQKTADKRRIEKYKKQLKEEEKFWHENEKDWLDKINKNPNEYLIGETQPQSLAWIHWSFRQNPDMCSKLIKSSGFQSLKTLSHSKIKTLPLVKELLPSKCLDENLFISQTNNCICFLASLINNLTQTNLDERELLKKIENSGLQKKISYGHVS